jgi:hypothetical protein
MILGTPCEPCGGSQIALRVPPFSEKGSNTDERRLSRRKPKVASVRDRFAAGSAPSLVERFRAAKPLAKNVKMHFDQSP